MEVKELIARQIAILRQIKMQLDDLPEIAIILAVYDQVNKDIRTEKIKKEKEENNKEADRPTEKQLAFLKKYIPGNLLPKTKKEASELIDNIIQKWRNENDAMC